MTPLEARTFVEEWQKKHPKEDLIVNDNGVMAPTLDGKRAVQKILPFPLEVVRECASDVNLSGRYKSMGAVLELLKQRGHVGRSSDEDLPQHVVEMGTPTLSEDGRPVLKVAYSTSNFDYAMVDTTGVKVLWVLQQRFVMGVRQKPEWTIMMPADVLQQTINACDEQESKRLRELWRSMDSYNPCGFATLGPWWLYCEKSTVANEPASLKRFRAMANASKKQEGGEALTFQEAMMPGTKKSPSTGAEYIAGSAIGQVVDEDDPLPF